jgi:hypothetical protein
MLSNGFLPRFKHETEKLWKGKPLDPQIYGFQFQAGTRWFPGLSEQQILAFENEVCARFPNDFRAFLRAMNGTDLPTLNIYGSSGQPMRESIGVYSFPRDLERVMRCISEVNEDRDTLRGTLSDEGFELSENTKLVPIYMHRFVACEEDQDRCAVLSIADPEDAIVYGKELQEYLEREFLGKVSSWAN